MSKTQKNIEKYHSQCVTVRVPAERKDLAQDFWEKTVSEILQDVEEKDGRFRSNVVFCGSFYDKTKVIEPNEFDLMLVLEKLELGGDDPYDSSEDNLVKDPPIGYTTVMIDEGEEELWWKGGCIARGENLLKAVKIKALFASNVREAIDKLNFYLSYDIIIDELKARVNGPAVTLKFEDVSGQLLCSVDLTLAIKDKSWPEDADEWVTRRRKVGQCVNGGYGTYQYQWPPKQMVDEIVRDGCHLVGKCPRPASANESEYLWRYSFSVAEKKLVLQLEPCWRMILRNLKALRERKDLNLYPLKSYHLKTIMLYEREENPDPSLWTEHEMGSRYRSALGRLLECLRKKGCPHYFMREVNLFDERLNNHYENLIKRITVIHRDPSAYLMKKLKD